MNLKFPILTILLVLGLAHTSRVLASDVFDYRTQSFVNDNALPNEQELKPVISTIADDEGVKFDITINYAVVTNSRITENALKWTIPTMNTLGNPGEVTIPFYQHDFFLPTGFETGYVSIIDTTYHEIHGRLEVNNEPEPDRGMPNLIVNEPDTSDAFFPSPFFTCQPIRDNKYNFISLTLYPVQYSATDEIIRFYSHIRLRIYYTYFNCISDANIDSPSTIYNLQGMPLHEVPQRGVYIQNGKICRK